MTHYYFSNSGKMYEAYFTGKSVFLTRVEKGYLSGKEKQISYTKWNKYKNELKPADKIHRLVCEISINAGL